MTTNENNDQKSPEEFQLLDFDLKAKQEIEQSKPKDAFIKTESPVKPVVPSNIQKSSIQKKPETTKQITSIEELKPELKNNVKKAISNIPEEKITKLMKDMETQKEIMFSKDNTTGTFGNLNAKEVDILMEKMNEWELPPELSTLNASVILSWLNKTSKDKK